MQLHKNRQAIHWSETASMILRLCSEVGLFCSYSLCAGVLAGHMEVNHFLAHNNVRYTIAIISHLTQEQNMNTVNAWVLLSVYVCVGQLLTGPKPPPSEMNSGWLTKSNSSICCTGVWEVERRQGSDNTCKSPATHTNEPTTSCTHIF